MSDQQRSEAVTIERLLNEVTASAVIINKTVLGSPLNQEAQEALESSRAAVIATIAERDATIDTLRELAKRAVVALHMYERSSGKHKVGFDECQVNLCADWHALNQPTTEK